MGYDVGFKIGIDGEAEFRKNIQDAAAQVQTLSSEMGAITAQFAKNATSQEAVSSKTKNLTAQIEAQKNVLAQQQDMLARATEKYGASSAVTQSWQQKVNKSTETLYKMENALDDVGKDLDDAADKTFSFGDALKAHIIGDLVVDGLKQVAGLIRDLAGESITAAAEISASNAQFEQTFGSLGGEAQAAIDRVADSAGILSTRLQGTGTQLYAFARSAGGDTAQSMDLMERALIVAADSAAYYDRSLEDTAESLQSFLKGNYANDAALGLSATETTRNAAAMELFGVKFKDLSEIQKQETLLKMVEDSMALSGAMGQAQREAAGWENVQGNLNEALRQAKADIGAGLLPAVTELSQALTGALTGDITAGEFGEVAGEIVAELVSDFAKAAPDMVGAGVEMIGSFLEGLMADDNIKEITDSATEILLTLVDGLAAMLPKIFSFAMDVILTLAQSLITHLPELLVKIPGLVGEMVAAFVARIPEFLAVGAQLIQGLAQGIADGIVEAVNVVKNLGSRMIASIKQVLGIHSPSRVFASIGAYMMEGLCLGMENSKGEVMETAEDIADEVTSRFKALTGALSTKSNIADLQYKLWEMTGGKDADDLEKYDRQLEQLTQQETLQGGAVQAAQAAYEAMADQYGETSEQALTYLETLLEEQIAYQNLAASIQEVLDKQAELVSASNLSGSYADLAGTMTRSGGGASAASGASTTQPTAWNANPTVFAAQITMTTEDGRNMGSWMTKFVNEENAANPQVVSDLL